MLVVGARNRTEVLKAFDNFYPVLCMFKKPNITTQSNPADTLRDGLEEQKARDER